MTGPASAETGGRSGVLYARGFRAAGVAAGLKSSGDLDVALVVNDGPLDGAAAVFTANRVKAAPVSWSQQVLRDGRARAVVLNSGGANACTGPDGFHDTHRTAEHVATLLDIGAGDVVVCSTGLIGRRLDLTALLSGVERAADALPAGTGTDAAQAICTTDTHAKQSTVEVNGWRVGGMVKGAGMLSPSLATMLCVITTDAVVDGADADNALRAAVHTTFDRIDSDGCMSTNDTVVLLVSGASGRTPAPAEFADALRDICGDLVRQLLSDAEGSTKDVEIRVVNAADEDDAVEVGRAIARNNLLKCALFGKDPNWGRVLAAVGTTSAAFDPTELDVTMNGTQVCRGGGVGDDPEAVDLSGRVIDIVVDLHAGDAAATILTNDLSHAYVHENSAYST